MRYVKNSGHEFSVESLRQTFAPWTEHTWIISSFTATADIVKPNKSDNIVFEVETRNGFR